MWEPDIVSITDFHANVIKKPRARIHFNFVINVDVKSNLHKLVFKDTLFADTHIDPNDLVKHVAFIESISYFAQGHF